MIVPEFRQRGLELALGKNSVYVNKLLELRQSLDALDWRTGQERPAHEFWNHGGVAAGQIHVVQLDGQHVRSRPEQGLVGGDVELDRSARLVTIDSRLIKERRSASHIFTSDLDTV